MKKASEVVLECLKAKGIKQSDLAREMGEDVRLLNQQLNRVNDMKVERFKDVLEHIGYHLEVVDNGSLRKATPEFAAKITETGSPHGLFYVKTDSGYIVIDSTGNELVIEEFGNFESCQEWLMHRSHAGPENDSSG